MSVKLSRFTLGHVHNLDGARGECKYRDWLWRTLQDNDANFQEIDRLLEELPSALTEIIWQYSFEPQDPWIYFLCSFPLNATWGSPTLKAWWNCPDGNWCNWRSIPAVLACLHLLGSCTPEELDSFDHTITDLRAAFEEVKSQVDPTTFHEHSEHLTHLVSCFNAKPLSLSLQWRMPKEFQHRIISRLLDAILRGTCGKIEMGLTNFGRHGAEGIVSVGEVVDTKGDVHFGVTFDDLNTCVTFHPPAEVQGGSSWMFPVCVQQQEKYFLFEFELSKSIWTTQPAPSSSRYCLVVGDAQMYVDWVKAKQLHELHPTTSPGSLSSVSQVNPFFNGGGPWQIYATTNLDELEALTREIATKLGVEVDDLPALTKQLCTHTSRIF